MTNFLQRTPPDVPGHEILKLIGLGGMGEVYLARQLTLNRPVAIKFLTRTAGDPPEEYELRFRREAELMARVSHPNVVTIFDFGTAGGRPYLVMEYIENGDLRSRMVPDVPMPVEEIQRIIRPVIRAVEYLHRQGIVHRDMKPENILIHHEETPKVTDFGIAVLDFAIGSLTRSDRALGTPGYVAPEQQYGLKVDERADQFSIAALCYELATGRKPLGAYPSPSKLNPKLGRAATEAILKGLSEDPADRFATIAEFGQALDRGLGARVRKFPARLTSLIVGLASLASLAGAGLSLSSSPIPNKPSAPSQPGVTPGPTSAPLPTTAPVPTVTPLPVSASVPAPSETPRRLLVRSVNMTLIKIPPGEFSMGSPATDPAAPPDERPGHLVRITRPFYLGETEVTVAQFRRFVDATSYRTTAESRKGGGRMFDVTTRKVEQKPEFNWRHPDGSHPFGDQEPVVQVSWKDAVAFCEALTSVEGRLIRLPTEAEWEYACRAGTTTRWCSGDAPESLDPFAWTLKNAGYTFHKVGLKRPNRWGLYDMHGNAWEWCSDWYGPYADASTTDPKGPPSGSNRVLRGGSYDWDKVERTRSASRLGNPPDWSYYNYGFRVCSPVEP